jgi:hypothetical protein
LELRIRQDGSIETTQLVSGHPMLSVAALESAQKSKFECHSCPEGLTSYSLLYTFALTTRENACEWAESSDGKEHRVLTGVISQSDGHVTIIAEPDYLCDPSASIRKVRSGKCLFLWRCVLQ